VKLHLGELTFDGESRQLLRGAEEVHLSPKAFELLKILVEQRPRALSKQELHERLWPDTFVSEVNLASLIAEIRAALGDTASEPTFIRTARRFGYAFCGVGVEAADTRAIDGATSFCWLIKDGRRVPLRLGENILGRDLDDGVRIDSPTVSRRHARIVISDGEAALEDLQSKNGTFVGEQPVSGTIRLKDGDEIRTGSVVVRFRMTSREGPTATWHGPRDE
jgi:DNA-binding winged helix-turn-helix (wHTH) protein